MKLITRCPLSVSPPGHYMYIETSLPRKKGDKAWYVSPTYLPTAGSCFQFWYHMFGKDIGTLNVYIKKGNNKLPGAQLWTRTGDRGDVWRVAQVTVSSTSGFNVRGGKKQTRGNTCYHSLLFSIFCDRFHLTLSICKGIEGTWREEHVGTCYPSLLFVLCVLSERITPLARAFRCGDRTHVAGKTRGNTCCPSLLVFPFSVIPQIITPLARHLGHLLSHLSVIFS